MKKTTFLLAALLVSTTIRADEAAAPSYSVTADFTYTSKYVFRGYELAEGALQPSFKFTAGDVYLGIWSSLPVDDGYEAEVDYYAGYGYALSDAWNLDVGITAYHYPGLDTPGADKTTFEGYVGVTGSIESVTVGLYLYDDFTLKAVTFQGNLGYSIPLGEKTSLNLSGSVGTVSPDAGDSYTYYGFGAQIPFKLSDAATLTVGGNWASHDLDGVDDNHAWATVGFSYAF